MKINGFNNLIPFIAAIVLFILILSVLVIPGCILSITDNNKNDTPSESISNKNSIETTIGSSNSITVEATYKNAPQDFSIKLQWNTGSLPPPYNYSYNIFCGPGSIGSFEYQSGYGLSQTPEPWITDFVISSDGMDDLYTLLKEKVFFRDRWEKSEPSIGGSYTIILINANGKIYEIPPDFELKAEDVQKIDEVAEFIKSLVPETIWVEMKRQQTNFEKSYEESGN